MYKLKSESDNTVVEEVNKKLVKEYHDFFVEILQRWKVIMDMVGVDKLVEEVKMNLVKEYNDFLLYGQKFSWRLSWMLLWPGWSTR